MNAEDPFFVEETDIEILMHKEVHFQGEFPVMLDYYYNEGKGIQEAFDIERIERLAFLEKQSPSPLKEILLTEEDLQKIEKAKEAYHKLQTATGTQKKLADLILSEEEHPEKLIEEVCALKEKVIPLLLRLLKEDDFYDPLFPGYGLAPILAGECLGVLKVKEAIIPLFEAIRKAEFFGEEPLISALFQIGDEAKDFLLTTLKKTPITQENENAAIALLPFQNDSFVKNTSLDLLELPETQNRPLFFTYLLLLVDSLDDSISIGRLEKLTKLSLPPELQEELQWTLRRKTPTPKKSSK